MKRLLRLFFFAALACKLSIAHADQPLWLYPIDPTERGKSIVLAINAAYSASSVPSGTQLQEVALETTGYSPFLSNTYPPVYISNGIIPYVQPTTTTGFVAAPNSTLFIVPYKQTLGTSTVQYVVLGVEQIVDVLYSFQNIAPSPIAQSPQFTSVFGKNTLPLYFIDPVKRAADIVSIVNTLITSNNPAVGSLFVNQPNTPQVWIQTTLNGPTANGFWPPFYYGTLTGASTVGLIPYVTNVVQLSSTSSLIQIFYQNRIKPPYQSYTGSVIVSAEQVQQVIFFYNNYPAPTN